MEVKPICHFKYNPKKEKLIIECQPVKPYTALDEVSVNRFNSKDKKSEESNAKNTGFKKKEQKVIDEEKKSSGLSLLA